MSALQESIYCVSPGDSFFLHRGTYFTGDLDSTGLILSDSLALISADGAMSCTLSALASDRSGTAG